MNAIINQLFEIEKKALEQNIDGFERNLKRIYHELEEKGYKIVNPLGTNYDERDSSIEANILNSNSKKITKVIRPTIYKSENNTFQLIQKAVVIVE
ncbi:hypothetical protein CLU83_3524 [Flavobacterium sp. 1]|uniref:hypothetical protein n=1 Tax=Flavobacterium sp. 1 TaxID=2035200 RepID=UPI000C24924E|nr:hypothetical protein [Flavobacterium sp. 1]PJJ10133.1 hypothetical protein CLU83_3524 [Flavobacterium sp. 1]